MKYLKLYKLFETLIDTRNYNNILNKYKEFIETILDDNYIVEIDLHDPNFKEITAYYKSADMFSISYDDLSYLFRIWIFDKDEHQALQLYNYFYDKFKSGLQMKNPNELIIDVRKLSNDDLSVSVGEYKLWLQTTKYNL